MHRSYLYLFTIISFNAVLLPMHFTRVAKTKPRIHTVTRNYVARKPQDDINNQKPTTISYKGNHYTPLELAQYAALQGLTIGMNVVKKCADSKVECKCVLPYMCFPASEDIYPATQSENGGPSVRERHQMAKQRLLNACAYLGENKDVSEDLKALQQALCPHTRECFKKLRFQAFKKPVFVTLAAVTVPMINPGMTFGALCGWALYMGAYSVKDESQADHVLHGLLRHLHQETKAINAALKKAEPYIMEKAKLQKEPTSKAAKQPLYLPLPQKKD